MRVEVSEETVSRGFLGGSVVKHPSVNIGDTGLVLEDPTCHEQLSL